MQILDRCRLPQFFESGIRELLAIVAYVEFLGDCLAGQPPHDVLQNLTLSLAQGRETSCETVAATICPSSLSIASKGV